MIVGEPGGEATARLATVVDVLDGAGVDVTASHAIRRDIWYKLWGNMTINPIAALCRVTADRILDQPLTEALVRKIMGEAQQIGKAIGCDIAEDAAARNAVTRSLGAFRPSMLQDVEAGRSMEVDALLGAPREIAQQLGIATPFIDALLGMMRLLDERHA